MPYKHARRPAAPWYRLMAGSMPILVSLCASALCLAQQSADPLPVQPSAPVQNEPPAQASAPSPVSAALTSGLHAPPLPSNHAVIITVSEYARSPLPGVLTDRKLGIDLAQRFGVPSQNIVEVSEQQVTRDGLKQAFATVNEGMLPGDKLFVYFSGHGARFYNKTSGQCVESIVMQDMHVVTNSEFTQMLKPLSAKADKTIVMLDSCHSGGIAQMAGSRAISARGQRAKFSPEASSPQCSVAVNEGSFSQNRGIELNTTDQNVVFLAAARKNEVAWDTSKGGALTYNFEQCLNAGAEDKDHSGSISMQELTECVQARLDKSQEESARQHPTLGGNSALVPAFYATESGTQPARNADALATMNDIYGQRDDRWQVQVRVDQPKVKIGSNLTMAVRSDRDGFVYLLYRGTQPDSFYLLFPNQLNTANAIKANQELQLPNADWAVTALGPQGTDHILVLVTETERDFSSLALPAEYVSREGPFDRIRPTAQASARIGQLATFSAAVKQAECSGIDAKRDLAVAEHCSNVFGASLVSIEETD